MEAPVSIQMVTPQQESNNVIINNKTSDVAASGDNNQFDPSMWTFDNNSKLGGAGVNRNGGIKGARTTSQGQALDDDVQARYD